MCESPGQLPCVGASEIKAKGQMTSAPDKCVDLITAMGSGGLNTQWVCRMRGQHSMRKQVFNDFVSNPWHSMGLGKSKFCLPEEKFHLPHIFRDAEGLKSI